MNFNIITIFPESIKGYFESSMIKRAQKAGLLNVNLINPRDFATDAHQKVDDSPFGGGPGMVMKVDVLTNAIKLITSSLQNTQRVKNPTAKSPSTVKVVMLSPAGKQFTQKMAKDWAKKGEDIILIAGHYEGVDERVSKIFKAEKISVGPYVLTGGELPAAIIVDAVARHVEGVLGKQESLEDERGVGIPVYTRPEIFDYEGTRYEVPKVLLSGHHGKIEEWRKKQIKK